MIKTSVFLLYVNQIATEEPAYKIGRDASDGFCDCIGLIKGAIKRAGGNPAGLAGTNYAARKTINLNKLTSEKQLRRGQVVLKSKDPSDTGYALPETYRKGGGRYNGDLRDYYHIGVVTGVNPLMITHMTTPSIKIDSKLGQWKWYGSLPQVESDNSGENAEAGEGTAIVNADKVAIRTGPTTSANVITRVSQGETVEVLPEPEDWQRVKYNGKTGYMMSRFIEKR